MADWLSSTADRSSTTGLPTKKPGERASVASISSSQPAIGTTGRKDERDVGAALACGPVDVLASAVASMVDDSPFLSNG